MPKAEAAKLTMAPEGTLVRLWPNAMDELAGPRYTGEIEGIVLGPHPIKSEHDWVQQTNDILENPVKHRWFVWRGHYDVLDDPNGRP